MADAVQRRVEAGLEELFALTQRQVLSEDETRQILRRRRDFEFECSSRHGDTVRAFLVYIHYEVNLLVLLRLRCRMALDATRSRLQQLLQQQRLLRAQQQQQKKKKQKVTRKEREKLQRGLQKQQQQQQRQQRRIARAKDLLHAVVRTGARRVYRLCRRLLQRHSTSLALWYSCLDLLLHLGSTRQLQQLLLHAIRQFPSCSGLWILAADRLLQHGQLLASRRLLLTALRFNSSSVALWTELLRLEATAAHRKAKALLLQQQQEQQDVPHMRTPASAAGADAGELKTQGHEAEAANGAAVETEAAAAAQGGHPEDETGKGKLPRQAPQVQGDAILVVLKAAVEKLQQRPRGTEGKRAAEEETTCNSGSNSSRLPRAVVASKVQDFLLRALELCLGLQASDAAPLMEQQLLPPLQQQLSLLLHEQSSQQPLLRVYEWKVLLLQAVAADSSNEAAGVTVEGRSGNDISPSSQQASGRICEEEGSCGGHSGRKTKAAVFQVLESILRECEKRPHMLLLLALLLHALHTSSSSSKTPPAAAEAATAAGKEKSGSGIIQGEDEENLWVFDVEGDADGDAEGVAHAVSTSSSSSREATPKGVERRGGEATAGTGTPDGARQLQTGVHLVQLYGGTHADFPARYTITPERDNAAAGREPAIAVGAAAAVDVDGGAASGADAAQAVHDAIALQQLEMLSQAGWPQVLLLLQRQPCLGRACFLLLHANVPTKEEAANGAAANTAEGLLAEPQLLQLQREMLWSALWDHAAATPSGEGNGPLQEQRLWLVESLLRALQQLHEQQEQEERKAMKTNGCTVAKSSDAQEATLVAAAAFSTLGKLLLELLQRAAAQVPGSVSEEEVYIHLKPLQEAQQRLQQLTESFLKQQQQQQIDALSLRKQHQQQVAELLLLLLEMRRSRLLTPAQQPQEPCDQQQFRSPKKKKKKQQQQEQTEEAEKEELQQAGSDTMTAALEVLRKLKGCLGVAEAAGLLEHCLAHSNQEQRSSSSSKGKRTEDDAAAAEGREQAAVHMLPLWFQELLAAASPAALPVLVKRFCQHGLLQRQQEIQEQLAQLQEDEEEAKNCFEGFAVPQQHKRRKLLPDSGSTLSKVHEVFSSRTAAATPPVDAAGAAVSRGAAATGRASTTTEVEAKKRRVFRWSKPVAGGSRYLFRGLPSPMAAADAAAVARVAAVLQLTSACVSALNDAFCCMRLCSAARLTVVVEMCDFAIQVLWQSIAYCWVSAAAATPTQLGEAASGWWSDMLVVLLQQSREVYACILGAFERCGMQQQLLLQDEKGGRGRRLQQQEEVLRRHVLQHVTNASQQQVQWWIDFWRFSRFCEEAAGLLQLQQSSCSHVPHSRATALSKPLRGRPAANGLAAAKFFVVEKREEAERQAEQALGEGSTALAAFREAVAAEVAVPCELQQHYPGGCTACGVNRLWCTYTAAAQGTAHSRAATSSSSAECSI